MEVCRFLCKDTIPIYNEIMRWAQLSCANLRADGMENLNQAAKCNAFAEST